MGGDVRVVCVGEGGGPQECVRWKGVQCSVGVLIATTGVPDLPFTEGSHRPKNLKNLKKEKKIIIHTFIHTFAHTNASRIKF